MLLVRPHLEYGAAVLSPHLKKDQVTLGNILKFGLQMTTRQWHVEAVHLPSLQQHKVLARLCLLYSYFEALLGVPFAAITHHIILF